MIDAEPPSQTFVSNPFGLGRPGFKTGGHESLVLEFDDCAYSEGND